MWQAHFDAALQKRETGDIEGALADLERLALDYPTEAPIHMMAGGLSRQLAQLSRAVPHFITALTLRPTLEIASRGLFHSLWDLGDHDSAVAEMHRFMAISRSEHYDAIHAELQAKGLL